MALTAAMVLSSKLPSGTSRYVALLTALPDADGVGAVEATGAGYVRAAHSAWINRTEDSVLYRENDGAIEFPVLTGALVAIVGWGVYDAATGGVLVAWGPITNMDGDSVQKSFVEGDMPRFLPQDISFSASDADVAWVAQTIATASSWRDICWSPELGIFVAVAGTGSYVATSPDGVTWTARTPASNTLWAGVCWSPELTLFVAVSEAASVMTSPDGTTWTTRTIGAGVLKVCWSPTLTLFCAVGGSGGTERIYTSPDGTTWTSRSVTNISGLFYDVCWSEELGLFCAVGDIINTGVGAIAVAVTSPDGVNWTIRNLASYAMHGVCWSPELGLFVAVGVGGGTTGCATSSDGITWASGKMPSAAGWESVKWSSELRLFVAVAWTGSGLRAAFSLDGATWAESSPAEANQWRAVCVGDGVIAAVASSGTNRAMTLTIPPPSAFDGTAEIDVVDELSLPKVQALMPPGLAWVRDADTILTSFLRALAYSFARVSRRALDLLEEVDPRTTYELLEDWERVYGLPDDCATPTTLAGRRAALLAKMNGNLDPSKANLIARALIVGYDLMIYEYKRDDLFDCESSCEDFLYDDKWMYLWSATYWPGDSDAELICALEQVTPDHTVLYDGVRRWQVVAASEASTWRSIAWSPSVQRLVAVASSGTNRVMYSSNGCAGFWTSASAAAAQSWMCVIWVEEISRFVAVSTSGTDRCMTSPDGITWTLRTLNFAQSWIALANSPELELMVAVSTNGTNRVALSDDGGLSWALQTAAEASAWQDICWSPELGLFVAVANSGTNRVMTSPDGSTWTARTAAEANEWNSVCWSPELGLFAAVAFTGTNRVMTSPDGINWTARLSAEQTEYKKVVWCAETDAFVAIGTNSMFSRDGITWRAIDVQEANVWHGLAWAPELGRLVAVAATGTNRVDVMDEQAGRRFYKAL